MPENITITSISRSLVDGDGGQLLEIQGDFEDEFGKAYLIHVGPIGDSTDPACYSGIAGTGHPTYLYPLNDTKLRGYLPPLTTGGPYNIYVRRQDNTRIALIAAVITVRPKQYYSKVFSMRKLLPPKYRTGPRTMELLEAI